MTTQGNHMQKGRVVINMDKHNNKVITYHSESESWATVFFIDAIPLAACRQIFEFNLGIPSLNTLQMTFFSTVFYI